MRRFLLLAVALASLPLPFAVSPQAAAPESSERPRYKSPLGLAVDEKGERAYVALHSVDALTVVDLIANKVVREIPVGKSPRSVRLGRRPCQVIYKGNDDDDVKAIVDPDKGEVITRIAAADEDLDEVDDIKRRYRVDGITSFYRDYSISNLRGVVRHPKRASWPTYYYVHQLAKANLPLTQLSQAWVFNNALSIPTFPVLYTVTVDEPQRGFADPSDVAISRDGKLLFICSAGADIVLAVDTQRLLKYIEKRPLDSWADPPAPKLDLTASRHYVIAKLPTQANPRRLALSGDGKTLVVSNYLSDSLTVIDAVNLKVVKHISLGGPKPDAARRGEILFNSGKMTFHGQFTCASCHPNGEADGLNWDLERDGVGNFKNTKSLLGIKDTAPYGWEGSSPTLADRVRGTLRTLHRHEPTDTEVSDLVSYLESLPPPRPLPVKEADKPTVARGKAIFEGKGKCMDCHHRAGFDDGKSHNVGTRGPSDTTDRFDTPSLRGVARTAPYLHDGRAATLEEVFTKHNSKQLHGAAHALDKHDLADLITYLRSL